MYQLINQYNLITGQFGLANTPEARNAYLREINENTDWFNTLFSNNVTKPFGQHHFPELKKSSFYASLSAMSDRDGINKAK